MTRILIPAAADQVTNYINALKFCGMEPVASLELPEDRTFPGIDGLLLPGGSDVDPARYGQTMNGTTWVHPDLDEAQFSALEAFVRTGRPVLGICRGNQVINIFFGGDLIQDLPEESKKHHSRSGQQDSIHPIHVEPGCWISDLYGTDFVVNSAHHQAINKPAPGFRVIAQADDGVNEAILNDELPILSIQWHPERMCGALRRDDTVDGAPIFIHFREMCEQRH